MKAVTWNTLVEAINTSISVLGDQQATDIDRLSAKHLLENAMGQVTQDAEEGKNDSPEFDGDTYDPFFDKDRLSKQLGRVFESMRSGAWVTLDEIALYTGDPEPSIGARMRDLRKPKFGSYVVHSRHRGDPGKGLYEYKLLKPDGVVIPPEQVAFA